MGVGPNQAALDAIIGVITLHGLTQGQVLAALSKHFWEANTPDGSDINSAFDAAIDRVGGTQNVVSTNDLAVDSQFFVEWDGNRPLWVSIWLRADALEAGEE